MTQALAKPAADAKDLRALLQSDRIKEQVAIALPRHMDPDRMLRVALTAVNKNPSLLQCSQSSVLSAIMTLSQVGLEPDGRNAHLIPYGRECQLIIDYKGFVALAKRNGIPTVFAELVYENDNYRAWTDEGGKHLIHEPDIRKDRGNLLGAYSYTRDEKGNVDWEYMTLEEISKIKARSRASSKGPWVTDENEMRKKTVLRRHSKRWDIAPELRQALDADFDRNQDERDVTPPRKTVPKFKAPGATVDLPDAPEETVDSGGEPGADPGSNGLPRDAATGPSTPHETRAGAAPAPPESAPEEPPANSHETPHERLEWRMEGENILLKDVGDYCRKQDLHSGTITDIGKLPIKLVNTLLKDFEKLKAFAATNGGGK